MMTAFLVLFRIFAHVLMLDQYNSCYEYLGISTFIILLFSFLAYRSLRSQQTLSVKIREKNLRQDTKIFIELADLGDTKESDNIMSPMDVDDMVALETLGSPQYNKDVQFGVQSRLQYFSSWRLGITTTKN
eukprot:UN07430